MYIHYLLDKDNIL